MSNITYDEIFLNDSNVLMFRPKLACAIGLHEAIIVNQIEYWIGQIKKWKDGTERDRHFQDGKWWVYNSLEEWHEQFPFMTKDLIQRKLSKLKKDGILFATSEYNTASFDRTLWYSINYDRLKSVLEGDEEDSEQPSPIAQNLGNASLKTEGLEPKNLENTHVGIFQKCMSGFSRDGSRDFSDTNTIDYSTETTSNTVSIDDKSESNNKKAKSILNAKSSPSRAIRTSSNFDVSLKKTLSNMRRAVGNDNDFAAMKYLTEYFFSAIALRCDKIHHVLSVKQCNNIYATLKERFTPLDKSTEDITWQIQYYLHDFVPRMDTLTMEHFATDGILTIGDYRLQNLDISDEDIDYRAYYISKHPDCLMAQEARKQILASAT
jgi:hypothetical protein